MTNAKQLPPTRGFSASFNLSERLRVLDIGAPEMAQLCELWTALEPEARQIAEAHWVQWDRFFGSDTNFAAHGHERMIELGLAYLKSRFTQINGSEWIESAERTVARAFGSGVALTAVLSMMAAGCSMTQEVLGRVIECSKEERLAINQLLFRMSKLECDVYA